jgi:hypothetical protein
MSFENGELLVKPVFIKELVQVAVVVEFNETKHVPTTGSGHVDGADVGVAVLKDLVQNLKGIGFRLCFNLGETSNAKEVG